MSAIRIEDMDLEISLLEATVEFDYLIARWRNPKTVADLSKQAGIRDVRDALSLNDLEVTKAGTSEHLDRLQYAINSMGAELAPPPPRQRSRFPQPERRQLPPRRYYSQLAPEELDRTNTLPKIIN